MGHSASAMEVERVGVVPRASATASTARRDTRRWWVLAICCAVIFSRLTGPPIWAITPPTLPEGFGADSDIFRLYSSIGAVPQVLFLMLGGVLGDLFGRRRMLTIGMVGYLALNLLCLAAPGLPWLISFRTLGMWCSALAAPLALAIIRITFDGRELPLALLYYTGTIGVAGLLAPLLGVVLDGPMGWRAMFAVPLVTAALSLLLMPRHLTESRLDAQHRRVDIVGSAVWATVSLVWFFALVESQSPTRWAGPVARLASVVGLIGVGWLVWYELHSLRKAARRSPIRKRELSVVLIVGVLINLVLVAYYLQLWAFWDRAREYGVVKATLALAPTLPGIVLIILLRARLGSLLNGREMMTFGLLIASGAVLFTALGARWAPYWWFVVPIMLVMMCHMVVATAWTTRFFQVVQRDAVGANAAINNGTGLIGGALGSTLGGALLVAFGQADFRNRLQAIGTNESLIERAAEALGYALRLDPSDLGERQRALLAVGLDAYRQSYAVAFSNALFVLAALCLGGAAVVWFGLREANAARDPAAAPRKH